MPLTGSNERMMMMLKFQLDTASFNSLSAYMDALKLLMTEAEARVEKLESLITAYVDCFDADEQKEIFAYMKECSEVWKNELPETTIVQ